MPKDEFDPEDPLEAIAVELPCDEDTLLPMAECFVEEFMRMGKNQNQILALFDNPYYAGAHMVYRARGAEFVKQLITDTFTKWGRATGCHPERSEGSQSFPARPTTEILRCAQNDKPETTEVDHV